MIVKDIIEAWLIANNPTESQRILAEFRGKICDDCSSKKMFLIPYCSECNCPIGKKIFTNNFNPCPLKKWEYIDKNYFNPTKEKKTLL